MKTPAIQCTPAARPIGLWLEPFLQQPRLIRFSELRFGSDKRRVVIGKSRMCDVWVEGDEHISGEHCVLEELGDELWLEDLESTNGTTVNEMPVRGRVRVQARQTIGFGQSVAILVDDPMRLPIVAATYSSFLAGAHERYGSSRVAGEAVHRSHATVQRATRKRHGS